MDLKKLFHDVHPSRIYFMLALTVLYFGLQMFMSHTTHALTLLVDAYHTLCNLIALAGCIISMRYGSANTKTEDEFRVGFMYDMKTPSTCQPIMADGLSDPRSASEYHLKNTFGWARIDILVMLIGCVFLASLCFSTMIEALLTLIHIGHQDEIHHPILVMTVGIIGLLLNGLALLLIGGYTSQKGKFLHVSSNGQIMSDKLSTENLGSQISSTPAIEQTEKQSVRDCIRDITGSILVIICSLIVYFVDDEGIAKYVDPFFSMLAVVILMTLSYPYLKKSCFILLQTIPDTINIDTLKAELLKAFPDILNVHDLHIWELTTTKVFSTAHIIFNNQQDYIRTKDKITKFFCGQGISQVTIQPEFLKTESMGGFTDLQVMQENYCLVQCQDPVCQLRHCCASDKHELKSITLHSHEQFNQEEKDVKNISNSEHETIMAQTLEYNIASHEENKVKNNEECSEVVVKNNSVNISNKNDNRTEPSEEHKPQNVETEQMKMKSNKDDEVLDVHL